MAEKIALLSDMAINQIAAGEVLENPASAVKELVDNALDAKASFICIDIQAGGHQLIRIEDDGCGMSARDAKLSIVRHATSKIRDISDLDALSTMGFRGEALAAIASVSKMEIRTSDGQEATRVYVEGGKIERVEVCARNRGTTFEISSLFYNAPARRKFQKSPQASTAAIVKIVEALAISHPQVAFTLRSQGTVLLDVKPSSLKERAEEVLGEEYRRGVWFDEGDIKGILGRAEDARSTRSSQHIFLNSRPIVSSLLSRALRDGYGVQIGTGSYPPAVLFFELEPDQFDVNVHPQKKEVRIRNESALFSKTLRAVQRSLIRPATFSSPFVFSAEKALCSFSSKTEPPRFELPAFNEQEVLFDLPTDRPLAVLGTYLLIECDKNVYVADLRGVYEERAVEKREKQSLLLPVETSLSLEEAQMADELLQRLEEAGLDARMVGPKRLCIDAIPAWVDPAKVESFVEALKGDKLKGLPIEATLKRLVQNGFSKELSLDEAALLWRQKRFARQIRLESFDLERLFLK